MFKNPDTHYISLCDSFTRGTVPAFGDWELDVRFHGKETGGLAGVYVSESRKERVLVFRGSSGDTFQETLRNVMTDVNFFATPITGVHRGFLRMLHDLVPYGVLDYHDYPLTVTGMSMGGALALLYARAFGCEEVRVFGCPKVTKHPRRLRARLRRQVSGDVRNYQLNGDLVTQMPPFHSWRHVGKVIELPGVWGPEHSRRRYIEALEASDV